MSQGKNVQMFLMDGDVTGRMKCTLANWTGLAFKIPRAHLDKCKNRSDLKQSGVYFLFGKNDANEDEVYIGQAGTRKNGEGILFRVAEHLNDKDYFNEAVMLTTQNDSFGPTEISYLENKFANLALETDRYRVRNNNDPNPGHVTEEKESELEEFIEYSKIVLGVLGYKVFVPLGETQESRASEHDSDELRLFLTSTDRSSHQKIDAQCLRNSEGFVLLKGSNIRSDVAASTPAGVKALRKECMDSGVIQDGVLMKNQLFTSPSYAACFVLGASVNGRDKWKTADGKTLNDVELDDMKE